MSPLEALKQQDAYVSLTNPVLGVRLKQADSVRRRAARIVDVVDESALVIEDHS
jgi:hypothetical protein